MSTAEFLPMAFFACIATAVGSTAYCRFPALVGSVPPAAEDACRTPLLTSSIACCPVYL